MNATRDSEFCPTDVDEAPRLRVLLCRRVRDFTWNFEALAAPYWRLYRNLQGEGVVYFAGAAFPMANERLYLIPPDTPFSSRSFSALDHFHVHFLAGPPWHAAAPGVFELESNAAAEKLVAETVGELTRPGRRDDTRLVLLCQALCMSALASLPADRVALFCRDDALQRALEVIERDPGAPHQNAQLAAVSGLSERTLSRRFRSLLGYSPRQYLLRRRVQYACILLSFSDESIERIAERTGFADRQHLSRAFKTVRGMGPAAFRKVRSELTPMPRDVARIRTAKARR